MLFTVPDSDLFVALEQVDYYGLHQLLLTQQALYVLVCNAQKFEGKEAQELDEVRVKIELGGRTHGRVRAYTRALPVRATDEMCRKFVGTFGPTIGHQLPRLERTRCAWVISLTMLHR